MNAAPANGIKKKTFFFHFQLKWKCLELLEVTTFEENLHNYKSFEQLYTFHSMSDVFDAYQTFSSANFNDFFCFPLFILYYYISVFLFSCCWICHRIDSAQHFYKMSFSIYREMKKVRGRERAFLLAISIRYLHNTYPGIYSFFCCIFIWNKKCYEKRSNVCHSSVFLTSCTHLTHILYLLYTIQFTKWSQCHTTNIKISVFFCLLTL